MRTSISSLLLCLSFVVCVAFAAPSAAEPQLDELNESLTSQLGDRVEAKTGRLSAAALERQTLKLASLHGGDAPLAKAPKQRAPVTCTPVSDARLHCVVLAGLPAKPETEGLAGARR